MQTLLYSVFPVIIHTRKLIILLRMGAFIIFSHCLMWSSPYLGPVNTLHTCSLITLFRNTFIIVGGMHGRAWICGCLKWVQRKTPSTLHPFLSRAYSKNGKLRTNERNTFRFFVRASVCTCAYLLRIESNDACEKFDISQTEPWRTNDSHLFLLSTG